MIGLKISVIENWKKAKAFGWSLDDRTIRHTKETLERELMEHRRVFKNVAAEHHETQFAEAILEAEGVLAEANEALDQLK